MSAVVNQVIAGTSNITAFGTYTPTITNGTNVASSTPRAFQYSRVGDTVSVSGIVDLVFTTPGLPSDWEVSIPLASNFTTIYQLAGCGSADPAGASLDNVIVIASISNNRAVARDIGGIDGAYSLIFNYTIV